MEKLAVAAFTSPSVDGILMLLLFCIAEKGPKIMSDRGSPSSRNGGEVRTGRESSSGSLSKSSVRTVPSEIFSRHSERQSTVPEIERRREVLLKNGTESAEGIGPLHAKRTLSLAGNGSHEDVEVGDKFPVRSSTEHEADVSTQRL